LFYTIYKITNNVNGKIYIGKHQTMKPDDSYMGSGRLIVNAIKKYGKNNFTKEVLFVFDNEEEMNLMEKKLITEDFCLREDTYNLGVGGEGGPHFKGKTHSEKTKELIRNDENAKMRRNQTLKRRIANGEIEPWNKGKRGIISDEYRQKLSDSAKKRPKRILSEETKRKISETLKNKNRNK